MYIYENYFDDSGSGSVREWLKRKFHLKNTTETEEKSENECCVLDYKIYGTFTCNNNN